MRYIMLVTVLVILGSALAVRAGVPSPGSEPDAPRLSRKDVLTWPRARVDRFGCFLEKAFGHRNGRFNCDLKKYVNHGDPCRSVDAWYEGPQFPANKVALVHPLVSEIVLSWEHGELQSVIVRFSKKMGTRELWKELGISDPGLLKRPNVMSVDVQQGSTSTSLLVQGFDHMGAGEADCGQ